MLSFSQCEYNPHIAVQLSIYTVYIESSLLHAVLFTITLPSFLSLLFTYASFSQCEYNPHIAVQLSIYAVYIESSLLHAVLFTITLPSILILLFTYAFLFTMWIFFHSYCIIFYSTMFTVLLHWIHAVLCTITHPSILYVLFTYASFSQCDIFSQLLPNWLYNNVYSISLTYTYSTVYNHCPQYTYSTVYNHCPKHTYFDVYRRFPFHNVNIFHTLLYICLYNNVTYNLLCLHSVMFKITLPSILTLLFTYGFLFTMWIFFHTLL